MHIIGIWYHSKALISMDKGECAVTERALLTPRQLAKESGWSERRIRSLIALKEIKHLKIGNAFYLPDDAVADYVRRNMFVPEGGGADAS
jgi:hypothetical protein